MLFKSLCQVIKLILPLDLGAPLREMCFMETNKNIHILNTYISYKYIHFTYYKIFKNITKVHTEIPKIEINVTVKTIGSPNA